MAQFRSYSLNLVRINDRYAVEKTKIESSGADRLEIMQEEALLDDQRNADPELRDAREMIRRNSGLTFFWLTVLMPVVSGFCFSIASSYSKMRRQLRAIDKAIKKDAKETEKLGEDFGKAEGDVAAWQLEEQFLAKPDWIESFARQLVDLYEYGFRIGSIQPELLKEIPNRLAAVEQYRNKRTHFKINEFLLKQNCHEN